MGIFFGLIGAGGLIFRDVHDFFGSINLYLAIVILATVCYGININEINKVSPLPICSERLKNEAAVPLCSGILTSIKIAFLFATEPAAIVVPINPNIKYRM